MYPYLRLIKVVIQSQFKPKMEFYSEKYDEINLTVLPNDIDPFMELNNGRYVTLLDLGRFAYGGRIKMGTFLKKNIRYSASAKRGSKRNPFIKEGDLISVKESFFGKSTGVIREFTAPFVGIYSTKEILESFND